MSPVEFLKLVGEIRNNCGLDCFGPNYYVFIHKGLMHATVNNTGYMNMSDVACVIVVCAYRWQNMGYVNNSLTQLMMVDGSFSSIESLPFGAWNFRGLTFTTFYGQYYNAWRPLPKLEFSADPSINNYEGRRWGDPDPFPEWEWPSADIKEFNKLLKSIQEFVKTHPIPDNKQDTK